MDANDLLSLLREADGDAALLALATVDLNYPDESAADRERLHELLQIAAVPHWFTASGLSLLTGKSVTSQDWVRLTSLPIVEPFTARGDGAHNVHETSRLALRRHLAINDPERLRHLSANAAGVALESASPADEIERAYHLLVADPDTGADNLAELNRQWGSSAGHAATYALAAALRELLDSQLASSRALGWSRLVVAQHLASIRGASAVHDEAAGLIHLVYGLNDRPLLAEVQNLLGLAAQARGNLDTAQTAYRAAVGLMTRLARLDPSNRVWQSDLTNLQSWIRPISEPNSA